MTDLTWWERGVQVFAWLAMIAVAGVTVGEAFGLTDIIAWTGVEDVQDDVEEVRGGVEDVQDDVEDVQVDVKELQKSSTAVPLGDCQAGLVVAANEYCDFTPDAYWLFRVVELGAYAPGSGILRRQGIKVDWDATGRTFQAVALNDGSGAWRIEATGKWIDIHDREVDCAVGDTLGPGQFCTERATRAQFRVYGSDQLNPDEDKELFDRGYGVLDWSDKDTGMPAVVNGRLGSNMVELRCPGQGSPFIAKRVGGTRRWVVERAEGEENTACAQQATEENEPVSGKGSGKE